VFENQLRLSRIRAMLVRQYLRSHFQLDPANVRIVAMKSSSAERHGTNDVEWDLRRSTQERFTVAQVAHVYDR
jgi:hypothetical protein